MVNARKVYFRHGVVRVNGKGVGAVLLDGGHGGQSSYSSLADMVGTVRGGSISSTFADIQHHLATGEPFKNGKHKRPPMSVQWLEKRATDALGVGFKPPTATTMPVCPRFARPVGLGLHALSRIEKLKPKAIHFAI
jgi:hypothetical protein